MNNKFPTKGAGLKPLERSTSTNERLANQFKHISPVKKMFEKIVYSIDKSLDLGIDKYKKVHRIAEKNKQIKLHDKMTKGLNEMRLQIPAEATTSSRSKSAGSRDTVKDVVSVGKRGRSAPLL